MPKSHQNPGASNHCPDVAAYIAAAPGPVAARLCLLAQIIREQAPQSTERLRYGMPTWHQGENLVHIGAFKGHIGIYPGPEAIAAFAEALAPWKTSPGAIQIPHEAELPVELVSRIVAWRVAVAGARSPKLPGA